MTVFFTERSMNDLAEIGVYIEQSSPGRSEAVLARLMDGCSRLRDAPLMGRLRPELADRVRSITVFSWAVFYAVETDRVVILRIIHGARDLATEFDSEPG